MSQLANRTPLTREQVKVARALKAIWLYRKGPLELTQVKAAESLGITQGALTQYLNEHIAVNNDFVIRFCQMLQVDPAEADPKLANVLLSAPTRVPVTYDWEQPLPNPGRVANILVENEEGLFGVRVPPELTNLRRWSIAITSKRKEARSLAISFIRAKKGGDWELVNECKGPDCWSVLAFVRER